MIFHRTMKEEETAPELLNVSRVCLQKWEENPKAIVNGEDVPVTTNGEMKPFRRNDEFGEETFFATQNQNDTGWDQLLKGKLSKHWANAQEICCRFKKKDKKHAGDKWSGKFVQATWMCSELTWLHRNDCKCGDGNEALDKQRDRLRPTVEKPSDKHEEKARAADRALFCADVERRMRRHPRMMKKWIRIVKMCMAQHQKEQKAEQAKQSKIAKCFMKRMKKRKKNHNREPEMSGNGTTQSAWNNQKPKNREKEQHEEREFGCEG